MCQGTKLDKRGRDLPPRWRPVRADVGLLEQPGDVRRMGSGRAGLRVRGRMPFPPSAVDELRRGRSSASVGIPLWDGVRHVVHESSTGSPSPGWCGPKARNSRPRPSLESARDVRRDTDRVEGTNLRDLIAELDSAGAAENHVNLLRVRMTVGERGSLAGPQPEMGDARLLGSERREGSPIGDERPRDRRAVRAGRCLAVERSPFERLGASR